MVFEYFGLHNTQLLQFFLSVELECFYYYTMNNIYCNKMNYCKNIIIVYCSSDGIVNVLVAAGNKAAISSFVS